VTGIKEGDGGSQQDCWYPQMREIPISGSVAHAAARVRGPSRRTVAEALLELPDLLVKFSLTPADAINTDLRTTTHHGP
jgi:hypothetical protein